MTKLFFQSPLVTTVFASTIAITALAMTGCATKPTYSDPNRGPTIIINNQGVPNYYQVKRGDTVSQIAARYRMNYRQIGALNNLDSKYTIYSGQMLKLWQGDQAASSNVNNNANNNRQPVNTAPVYNAPTTPAPAPAYDATANLPTGYGYPSTNKVVRNFDAAAGNMGMWFAGKEGDPVVASQGGTVLYSGNGLAEYGNLIMIRHSDDYITAYAHNSQLLVKEGEAVQIGQRVANMGSSGQTNQVGLEFQVRLNGNPIDPRAVLGR